ncbi:MAG TPA: protein translocase subunit SecD [Phycisphaerae bacterium]|nr:protein translocase subunit SecD [Phycisphaerae bacterium]
MHERDLWWKIVIVGALAALGFASIWPLDQKLKYGIDLYGGYSLLYEIDDTGLEGFEKQGLAEEVMKVLRERVDPKGVFNLVWRPVGHNRLEIQMPRPSKEIVEGRQKYEQLQEEIQNTIVRRTDVLRAVAKPADQRPAAFDALVHGVETRRPLLTAAATNYDAYQNLQKEYDARVASISKDNLSREDVLAAVKKPAAERSAAFESLIRGIPARRALLEEAAKAADALAAAESTTRPADGKEPAAEVVQAYGEKTTAFETAIAKVLDANVDPNKLSEGVTINQVVQKEEEFDKAVADVLATNLDIGKLQTVLEAKPGDAFREQELKKLTTQHPSMAGMIDGMVKATDQLRTQRRGEGRLEDPADLQRLLKGAGVLEFRILAERDDSNPDFYNSYREAMKNRGPRKAPGEDEYQWFEIEDPADFLKIDKLDRDFEAQKAALRVIAERFGNKYYVLARIGDKYALTRRLGEDWSLKGARFDRDDMGRPAIGFTLDERGGDKFAQLTRTNLKKPLCIFLDDQAISSATIESVIRTSGIIHGSFTPQEVHDMVKKLNAGSLPRKLKDPPISVRSIGPSLGEANRAAGLTSAKYGAIAVAVFMIGYYFYAGGVAVIAVALNLLFTMAMMALMGATLTLPGIAGLVLSMAMAVDANVLINERMREELAKGTAMRMAIRLGYERAFSAILDSNVSTMLTCVILYFLGSEEIKGFGLTLGIGVAINLFTAYFVTRMFFEMMSMISIPKEIKRYPALFGIGVAAFGGLLYGLGYWWNAGPAREHSVLIAFGWALIYVGPGIIGLFALMWIGRAIHAAFQKGERPRMPMMRIIGAPAINWVGLRPVFFTFSLVISIAGLFMFFNIKKEDLYDIEFLGGTAAQIDLKTPGSLNQTQISERLAKSGETLRQYGQGLSTATVAGTAGTFTLNTPGVPAARLEPVIKSVMDTPDHKRLSDLNPVRYSDPDATEVVITTRAEENIDLERMKGYVKEFAERFTRAGEAMEKAQVQGVQTVGRGDVAGRSFEIVTLENNKEIVVGAIMDNLQGELDVQPALSFHLVDDRSAGGVPYFALRTDDPKQLGVSLDSAELANIDLQGWRGGVALVLEQIQPPQSLTALKNRLRSMRLQPGFESHGWRESDVFGLTPSSPGADTFSKAMVVVADENYPLLDEQGALSSAWVTDLAEPEVRLLQAALQRQTSLSQITQFDQQVSGEAQTDAYIAIALSWLVIIVYVWFRFGNIRWGLAAVVALIHDVIVAIGAIAASHYLFDTAIGKALLLDKFRVDLALVAALMTVIGYSVNDTIVVFDRIRENRGRLSDVSTTMLNQSISQTLARTLLTGLTTFFTILIMYIFGGPGIHGFNFAMFIGILTGTYSSFAIASQFLVKKKLVAMVGAR